MTKNKKLKEGSTDSDWNKMSYQKTCKNFKQKDGMSLQQALGIRDEGPQNLMHPENKLSLVDILDSMYETEDEKKSEEELEDRMSLIDKSDFELYEDEEEENEYDDNENEEEEDED